jgi:hypothetical protein
MSEINPEAVQQLIDNEKAMLQECQLKRTELFLTQEKYEPITYAYAMGGWESLILYHETQIKTLEALIPDKTKAQILTVDFKRQLDGSK